MERNKKISEKNKSLLKQLRTQERTIETLKKQEAHTMQVMSRQNIKPQSESTTNKEIGRTNRQIAKQYADASRRMQLEQKAEVNEAIAVRKRRAMMKNSSSQAAKMFKAARISANRHQRGFAKDPRLLSVYEQESVDAHARGDDYSTTSDRVVSNLNLDGCNPSSKNAKKKRSVNAILSPRTPASSYLARGKPPRKKDERPSHNIMKWLT